MVVVEKKSKLIYIDRRNTSKTQPLGRARGSGGINGI